MKYLNFNIQKKKKIFNFARSYKYSNVLETQFPPFHN